MARLLLTAADFKALPIPQGLIGWWTGNYTAIAAMGFAIAAGGAATNDPTYTRPSLCDSRFPKGAASAGGTGGASTHTHTLGSHGHTLTAVGTDSDVNRQDDADNRVHRDNHTHTVNANSASFDAASNEPAHTQAIPIVYTMKAGGGARGLLNTNDLAADALLPLRMIGAYTGSDVPTNWACATVPRFEGS